MVKLILLGEGRLAGVLFLTYMMPLLMAICLTNALLPLLVMVLGITDKGEQKNLKFLHNISI